MADYIDIRLRQGETYKGVLTPDDDPATRAVNAIFADLRDRRFLKWLFDAHYEEGREIMPGLEGLSPDIQQDIATTWREIIRRAANQGPSSHDE